MYQKKQCFRFIHQSIFGFKLFFMVVPIDFHNIFFR